MDQPPDDTDVRAARSRVLAGIAASNAKGLDEVLSSIPPKLLGLLEMELNAAQAVQELLSKVEHAMSGQAKKQADASELKRQAESEAAARVAAEETARRDAAQHQADVAQLRAELTAAKGQAPPSSEVELQAVAQETRINELQAVVVSLQTQLRQAEMKAQQLTLEVAAGKEAVGPTVKAMRVVEEELANTQRLLRTSEASNATLLTQVATLQQRASGAALADGLAKPLKPSPPIARQAH